MTALPNELRHVLIPTDGTQSSITAGELALKWSSMHLAHITFVYVVDTAVARSMAIASRKTEQHMREELELNGQHYLDYLMSKAEEAGLTSAKVIRHGVPYVEIANLAREVGAELIVIAQNSGTRQHLIGSVTQRVIEIAPCPVLVFK